MKTAKELGITEKQRYNLAKLALFFLRGGHRKTKTKFNIKNWFGVKGVSQPHPSRVEYNTCGTSACLVGFGLAAGVRNSSDSLYFSGYCSEEFTNNNTYIYQFLFDFAHTNTIAAGVRRIAYFLENGLPPFNGTSLEREEVSDKPDRKMLNKIVKDYENALRQKQ